MSLTVGVLGTFAAIAFFGGWFVAEGYRDATPHGRPGRLFGIEALGPDELTRRAWWPFAVGIALGAVGWFARHTLDPSGEDGTTALWVSTTASIAYLVGYVASCVANSYSRA